MTTRPEPANPPADRQWDDGDVWLPLYEAKLIHQFDHRFATYTSDIATRDVMPIEHSDPAFTITPRYWVREADVRRAAGTDREWFIGFRDIARSTDERTAIFSFLPLAGVGHTAPLVQSSAIPRMLAAAIGCVNSLVFDFVVRQKVGGTHLTFFVVKQLPVLPPETYTPELLDLIVPRVLELTCTAHDLASFARDCGYDGPPFAWDEERRSLLRAELDGLYAHLYGLDRDDFAYILDQFPIVRRNDEKVHGEFRTKHLCLDAWDRFAGVVP